ncbi:pseudouridine synthase [Yamadazyma tenuis]|uniref:pseudouridine synthase n=1 Tax=Candida tenuis TaxID=2315449 RepID=UPI00279C3859|nr:pseudouridine synthase [Yamadazyma tenuis]
MSSAPSYVIENGLRKVLPYYQSYKTHIKTRWEGRTILDVFSTELGQPPDVITQEISDSKIYVLEDFGKKTSQIVKGWDLLQSRKIQKHDVIFSIRHMHEPSVVVDMSISPNTPNTLINVIFHDHNYLVVNKPAGIPVHPTSNYLYNSVSEILKFDLKLENIWTSHRLDKVTSGVLILGLNKDTGSRLSKIIEHKSDHTTKTYFARVQGYFPDTYTYKCPIVLVNPNGGYLMPGNLSKLVTSSTTKFKRLQYSTFLDESIVECTPISGKMHQIRVHLRNIGFPITNDWVYNNLSQLTPINRLKNDIELKIYDMVSKSYPQVFDVGECEQTIDLETLIKEEDSCTQLV